MKKLMVIVLAVTVVAMFSGIALAGQGNDLPSGPHYNLNLIGMEKDKNPNMGCGGGHRIFVQLSKTERATTRIMLTEGPYDVLDCDGTDGTASFQLPDPDPENDGTTVYSVFIRLRGKPGGDIIMDTCATDPNTGEEVCSTENVVEVRETGPGKNKFRNVSKELLYIYAWIVTGPGPDGIYGTADDVYTYMRVPLFSTLLQDYLWQYDNNGVRIAQLRFYEVPTTVPPPVP